MKKLLTVILISTVAFCGCGGKKHPRITAKIDSLYIVIDSIEKNLFSTDTVIIKKAFEEYSTNIGLIRDNFNDKKEDSVWSVITTYGLIRKPLKDFIRNYPGYYKEIKYSRNQLDSLKADIENGNIEENKVKEYADYEADAVNSLKILVDISVNGAKEKLKLFDSLNPKVIKVIDKLKKDKKKPEWKSASREEDD